MVIVQYKQLFTLFAFMLNSLLISQVPSKISYQAVIRDNSNILKSTPVTIKISILNELNNNDALFEELHYTNTNANGLVSLIIGDGNNLVGSLDEIKWEDGKYFIKSEMDPSGGTNYSISGITQLLSVPYSFHAKTAESLTDNGLPSNKHFIGEFFEGGIIFNIFKGADGKDHGLIVSLNDNSDGYIWSNVSNNSIGSSNQISWNGDTNTSLIISQPGHIQSAASLCDTYSYAEKNDWYLPSINEMSLLWEQFYAINRSLSYHPNSSILVNAYYWSSTEYGPNHANKYGFTFGNTYYSQIGEKNEYNRVRCIRYF